jgi:hypothetical protein
MRTFGLYVMVIGLLSIVFQFFHINFIFLNWIDKWGTQTGWIIRGGFTLIGLLLWLFGKKEKY